MSLFVHPPSLAKFLWRPVWHRLVRRRCGCGHSRPQPRPQPRPPLSSWCHLPLRPPLFLPRSRQYSGEMLVGPRRWQLPGCSWPSATETTRGRRVLARRQKSTRHPAWRREKTCTSSSLHIPDGGGKNVPVLPDDRFLYSPVASGGAALARPVGGKDRHVPPPAPAALSEPLPSADLAPSAAVLRAPRVQRLCSNM